MEEDTEFVISKMLKFYLIMKDTLFLSFVNIIKNVDSSKKSTELSISCFRLTAEALRWVTEVLSSIFGSRTQFLFNTKNLVIFCQPL